MDRLQSAPVNLHLFTHFPNYLIYQLPSSSGMPRIHAPSPEDVALFVIAKLFDNYGLNVQLKVAYVLLVCGRGGPRERGCRVLDEIRLTRVSSPPSLGTEAMNNRQNGFPAGQFCRFLPGRDNNRISRRRNKCFI